MAEVTEDGAESTQASGTRQEATKDTPSTTTSGKKVFLQEKIFVPVNEYPNVSFLLVSIKHRVALLSILSCKILTKSEVQENAINF